MLILTGIVVEITQQGPRHMLTFAAPRAPGVHYKVEADAETAARMQLLISAEVNAVAAAGHMQGQDDEDQPRYDPFNRC